MSGKCHDISFIFSLTSFNVLSVNFSVITQVKHLSVKSEGSQHMCTYVLATTLNELTLNYHASTLHPCDTHVV